PVASECDPQPLIRALHLRLVTSVHCIDPEVTDPNLTLSVVLACSNSNLKIVRPAPLAIRPQWPPRS
ncbi:hypothetical protein PoB_003398000, partial [Plakobranchus ocellatus]